MTTEPRAAATISDVATLAGGSIATVSRALRGFDNVAPTTAERVIDAARKLRYTSNTNASMLRSGTSHTITVVVASLTDWYHAEIMASTEVALSEAGYDTLVSVASNEAEFERVLAAARPGQSSSNGLIIVEQQLRDEHKDKLQKWGCPVVVIGQQLDAMPCVAVDDRSVGVVAAEHLISLGHERIGLIEGTGHRVGDTSARALRRAGFLETLQAHNRPTSPDLQTSGPYTVAGGKQAAGKLFAQAHPPTAVFCMSDLIALGAMQTLKDLQWRIPEDVSIVGVDDQEIAKLVGLTTVRQPVGELATRAAQLVLDLLDNENSPSWLTLHTFPIELVERDTTAAKAPLR